MNCIEGWWFPASTAEILTSLSGIARASEHVLLSRHIIKRRFKFDSKNSTWFFFCGSHDNYVRFDSTMPFCAVMQQKFIDSIYETWLQGEEGAFVSFDVYRSSITDEAVETLSRSFSDFFSGFTSFGYNTSPSSRDEIFEALQALIKNKKLPRMSLSAPFETPDPSIGASSISNLSLHSTDIPERNRKIRRDLVDFGDTEAAPQSESLSDQGVIDWCVKIRDVFSKGGEFIFLPPDGNCINW